ncbi:MAG TPA: peroxidase-related enzyme [Allocoleopsis sp.]
MFQALIKEYETLSDPKAIAVYDEIRAELGFGMVPNLFKSMATRPEFLAANWQNFRSTVLQGELPRILKEMIGVVISQANQSEYALKVHLHGLSALGISEEVLQTLVADFDRCPLPEREKVVIHFGLVAATHPRELTETDYQRLRELGLDEAEIFEILATANLFTQVNQYTDAIALEIDSL